MEDITADKKLDIESKPHDYQFMISILQKCYPEYYFNNIVLNTLEKFFKIEETNKTIEQKWVVLFCKFKNGFPYNNIYLTDEIHHFSQLLQYRQWQF